MVKSFRLNTLTPGKVLDQVHRSGIIDYMFNWGYTMDEERKTISFNIRYTGGSDQEQESRMMMELESFIKSIDVE
jgi:hypothetical protein